MNEDNRVVPECSFSALAKKSWISLKGKWLVTIGVFLIVFFIQAAANSVPVLQIFAGLLLFPLTAGLMFFMLRVIRGEQPPEVGIIFDPFNQYWRYVWANLRMAIFIFLWSLLLIIPGIIAGLRYALTVYIMLDNPQYTVKEAMTESGAVMYGHKLQLFGYSLLFMLIFLIAIPCTLGIAVFWLIPWAAGFMASFYDSVRRLTEADETSASTENSLPGAAGNESEAVQP